MKQKIFQKGDTVYDSVVMPGIKGSVIDYEDDGSTYSLVVQFGNGANVVYTSCGRYAAHFAPTLSFCPYILTLDQKRPVSIPEKGKPVLVWNNGYPHKRIRISMGELQKGFLVCINQDGSKIAWDNWEEIILK